MCDPYRHLTRYRRSREYCTPKAPVGGPVAAWGMSYSRIHRRVNKTMTFTGFPDFAASDINTWRHGHPICL